MLNGDAAGGPSGVPVHPLFFPTNLVPRGFRSPGVFDLSASSTINPFPSSDGKTPLTLNVDGTEQIDGRGSALGSISWSRSGIDQADEVGEAPCSID